MPKARLRLSAAVISVTLLMAACAGQNAYEDTESNRHVVSAELALSDGDYREAALQYRASALTTTRPETIRHAAEMTFEFGRDEDAEAVIEHWASVLPEDPDAPLYQGRMALRAGDADAAAKAYLRFVELSAERGAALDTVAQVLLYDGEDDAALTAANLVRAAFADVWQAERLVSRVAMRSDEKNLAMEAAERAYELAPESFEAGMLQAQAIVLGGDRSAGLEFAAEIAAGAQSSDELLEYAGLLAAADAIDDAKAVVSDIRRGDPDNADALKAQALLQMRAGNLEEAWRDLSELAFDARHQHDAMFYLGTIAERQQRNAQAIRIYTQIGDGPNTITAQQRVSEILVRTGREDEAVEHLEEFSMRHPEFGFRLLLPRAALLRELQRYDEAVALYDRVLDLKPRTEAVLLTRAETLLLDDRLDDAISAYREAVEFYPQSAASLNALGYTLADRTTQYREARRLIARALELDPDNPAIIDSMGWIEFKLGEFEQALVHLERAWELIKDPEVAAHLGETLWMLGHKERAKAILKEAYDRAPNSKPLRETLQRLLEAEAGIES